MTFRAQMWLMAAAWRELWCVMLERMMWTGAIPADQSALDALWAGVHRARLEAYR